MDTNPEQIEHLAESAHELWKEGYLTAVWRDLQVQSEPVAPQPPVHWDQLPEAERELGRGAVRAILRIIRYAGYQIVPVADSRVEREHVA